MIAKIALLKPSLWQSSSTATIPAARRCILGQAAKITNHHPPPVAFVGPMITATTWSAGGGGAAAALTAPTCSFTRPSSPSNYCRRSFSSSSNGEVEPILDVEYLQTVILQHVPAMAEGLWKDGYYTTQDFLPKEIITTLRKQSIFLRRDRNRFEPSWSEKITASGETLERFDKEGVYACEPDGQDYYDAPDLILYMSILLQTLPEALNQKLRSSPALAVASEKSVATSIYMDLELSNQSFNAKLAVTEPGGSKYPLHIDNPQGLTVGDTRKLTCILYLNPDYEPQIGGGELRIFLPSVSETDNGNDDDDDGDATMDMTTIDLTPEGGRLLAFWSDEIPHEVLPTAPSTHNDDDALDRYALTVWIPTDNVAAIHNESSKFRSLKDLAF